MLGRYRNNQDRDGVTIIGIARGGVIVAGAIAEKLNADFDIIAPRKLSLPMIRRMLSAQLCMTARYI